MSYNIEYNKAYFKFNYKGEELLMYLRRSGDNNVREWNGSRIRDWNIHKIDTMENLIEYKRDWKETVEGGSVQKSIGWEETEYFNWEKYFNSHVNKMKKARPIELFHDYFLTSDIGFYKDENYHDEVTDYLLNTYEFEKTDRTDYYRKNLVLYKYRTENPMELIDIYMNAKNHYNENYRIYFGIDSKYGKRV